MSETIIRLELLEGGGDGERMTPCDRCWRPFTKGAIAAALFITPFPFNWNSLKGVGALSRRLGS